MEAEKNKEDTTGSDVYIVQKILFMEGSNFFTFALYIRQQGVTATTATLLEEKGHKVPMKCENSPLINF